MLITKNTFEIRCKHGDLIKLLFYDGATLFERVLVFSDLDEGFKVAEVDSEQEGHYFIVSGRNFQSLRKGYSPLKMFLYDRKQRSDLVLSPHSYTNEGIFLGENDYLHIGSGIYLVEPVNSDPSIVEIFGKMYYSFIYNPEVQMFALQGPSTPIGIDIAPRKFSIKVSQGEEPDLEIDRYSPVLTIR